MGMNLFDERIIHLLNDLGNQHSGFDQTMVFLHEANILKGHLFTATFLLVWFFSKEKKEDVRKAVILTMLGCLAALFFGKVFSLLSPFRLRPINIPDLHAEMQYHVELDHIVGWSSFPSDNAVMFFTLAMGLFFISKTLGTLGMVHAALGISLPRVYVGMHYPTDMIVGGIIGVSVAYFANTSPAIKKHLTDFPLKWLETHPISFYLAFFFMSHQLATQYRLIRDIGHEMVDILVVVGKSLLGIVVK